MTGYHTHTTYKFSIHLLSVFKLHPHLHSFQTQTSIFWWECPPPVPWFLAVKPPYETLSTFWWKVLSQISTRHFNVKYAHNSARPLHLLLPPWCFALSFIIFFSYYLSLHWLLPSDIQQCSDKPSSPNKDTLKVYMDYSLPSKSFFTWEWFIPALFINQLSTHSLHYWNELFSTGLAAWWVGPGTRRNCRALCSLSSRKISSFIID